jgi:hypothetical protein
MGATHESTASEVMMQTSIDNRSCGAPSQASPADLEERILRLERALIQKERENSYLRLLQRTKDLIQIAVPRHAVVLAISKGDDEFLNIRSRCAWHFPQMEDGTYAGCHPSNSQEAVAHLEALRCKGAVYLLIPSTAFWWLEFYASFSTHLQHNYRLIAYHEDTCLIYHLNCRPT